MEDPLADCAEGLDAGGVKHLGGEVAAEGAPRGAVGGRADVVLIAGEDLADGESGGAVGEEGALVDEGVVGEGAVGDEDGRAKADAEGQDGAVFGPEAHQDWLHLQLRERPCEPYDAGDEGDVWRPWRQRQRQIPMQIRDMDMDALLVAPGP